MGSCIIKLRRGDRERYLIWSTVVDAPTTYGMTLGELHQQIQEEFGQAGLTELPAQLERVEQGGCSMLGWGLDDLVSYNRAGVGETHLTVDQLWDHYCNRPDEEQPADAFPDACTHCSVCGGRQYLTPGGACCTNGHGGAEPAPVVLPEPPAPPEAPVRIERLPYRAHEVVSVKRCYLPFLITAKCPQCGVPVQRDFSDNYLMYPNLGEPMSVELGHEVGEYRQPGYERHDFKVEVVLDWTLRLA